MSVASQRKINLIFEGDVDLNTDFNAGINPASPGGSVVVNLASGANTITVPTGGATVVAATIIPPAGNTIQITLKGVTGDTGVALHLTDPTSLGLAASQTTFCLTAANTITGVRILFS
jgi:hypothetical protein